MSDSSFLIPLDADIVRQTPPEVVDLLLRFLAENQALREENQRLREENKQLHNKVTFLESRVEKLEARLKQNSSNSNRPPSSDSLFIQKPEPPKKEKKTRKRKGVRQAILPPTEVIELRPDGCTCGCCNLEDEEGYYTHQLIEVPEVEPNVTHVRLHRGRCQGCGKTVKAHLRHEMRSGFGPRFCALIIELLAVHATSRRAVKDFLLSFLGIPISQGSIQNIYEAIGEIVRDAPVNHIDETSWKRRKALEWLWVMCNSVAAFFMLHCSRSRKAFQDLVQERQGILVSDDYAVYRNWVHGRQACLAHLIRTAKGLAERNNPTLSRPGSWILKELRLLCRMAKHPPTVGD